MLPITTGDFGWSVSRDINTPCLGYGSTTFDISLSVKRKIFLPLFLSEGVMIPNDVHIPRFAHNAKEYRILDHSPPLKRHLLTPLLPWWHLTMVGWTPLQGKGLSCQESDFMLRCMICYFQPRHISAQMEGAIVVAWDLLYKRPDAFSFFSDSLHCFITAFIFNVVSSNTVKVEHGAPKSSLVSPFF